MFFWEALKNLDEEFALSPRSGRQPFIISTSQLLGYRTLRALRFLTLRQPGVPLRSTPGFMLAPAARVLEELNPH
jgi:hypothetical protein